MIILDTETTDFRPGQIAQLSYILADSGEIVRAENYFFTVEYMSPGAEQVHGFSEEILRELSEGRTFADQMDRFRDDFMDRMLVAHNVSFDLSFLAAEFSRCGLSYSPKTFCTMRKSTPICRIPHPNHGGFKWPRLEEALHALEISPEEVNALASKLFGGEQTAFHDARFDSAAVWLIYQWLKKNEYYTLSLGGGKREKKKLEKMMIEIRSERIEDIPAIHTINERAFGQPQEADLVDELRRGCEEFISLVAVTEEGPVGHILFTPATIEIPDGVVRGMGLAPLAVLPANQKQGIGSQLIREGLRILRDRGCPFVIVLGHPGYYPRFGFETASKRGLLPQWEGIPDEAFMTLILDETAMREVTGVARYRDEFDAAV